ncbi:MAG TPA: hypothetical protein VKC60_16635 [Opitutaceae bacterium]|nr:hypothetical protein [Opitutaceae bacterium]
MQRFICLALIAFTSVFAQAHAQERFTDRLTPDQLKAAGLDKLTPEQLAALDDLVKQDREEGLRKAKDVTRQEVREEVKAAVRQEVQQEIKQQAKSEAKAEIEAAKKAENQIEGKIVGDFRGWAGRTLFELENGQVWRQTDGESYVMPPIKGAEIIIKRSTTGGWRLYLKGTSLWVKVKRLD